MKRFEDMNDKEQESIRLGVRTWDVEANNPNHSIVEESDDARTWRRVLSWTAHLYGNRYYRRVK